MNSRLFAFDNDRNREVCKINQIILSFSYQVFMLTSIVPKLDMYIAKILYGGLGETVYQMTSQMMKWLHTSVLCHSEKPMTCSRLPHFIPKIIIIGTLASYISTKWLFVRQPDTVCAELFVRQYVCACAMCLTFDLWV